MRILCFGDAAVAQVSVTRLRGPVSVSFSISQTITTMQSTLLLCTMPPLFNAIVSPAMVNTYDFPTRRGPVAQLVERPSKVPRVGATILT